MEQMNLQKIREELASLRQVVEEMSEVILEDNLELADDLVAEIKEAKKAPKEDFVLFEDVKAEFLND